VNAARIIEDALLESELENAQWFEAALAQAVTYMPDDFDWPDALKFHHKEAEQQVAKLRRRLGLTASSERAGGV
jgi:hypothetical protein